MHRTDVRVPITLRLPFAAASVREARQQLTTWLSDHHRSREAIEDARVVVSELVANAVRHARPLADGSLVVAWACEGGDLQVSVTDGGSATRPQARSAAATAPSGRGMAIVDTLTQTWWTDGSADRSTVHAVLEV